VFAVLVKENTSVFFVTTELDKIAAFLVESSLFIAVIGVAALYFSFKFYELPLDVLLFISCFLTVFSVYSLNKLTDAREDAINLPDRARFVAQNGRYVALAVLVAYSSALLLALVHSVNAMLVIAVPLVMGFLYSVGVSSFRLKNLKGLKSIVIASTWAVTLTLLPLTVSSRPVLIVSIVLCFFVFVRFFVNVVLFDLRDIEGDVASGMITIPAYVGRNKTKNLLLLVNSTLVIWLAYSYMQGLFHQYLAVFIFSIVYAYFCILHFCASEKKIGKSLDFLVDGEWLLIVVVALFVLWHF
jgi:4-hydroxybenzoate polyprenyltransferase